MLVGKGSICLSFEFSNTVFKLVPWCFILFKQILFQAFEKLLSKNYWWVKSISKRLRNYNQLFIGIFEPQGIIGIKNKSDGPRK